MAPGPDARAPVDLPPVNLAAGRVSGAPTIGDVARVARVSTATVSRVLGGGGSVRASTRVRVLAAARRLDYVPSPNARSLAGLARDVVEVVVDSVSEGESVQWLAGVDDAVACEPSRVVVVQVLPASGSARERALARVGRRGSVSLVVARSVSDEDLAIMRVSGARVVPIVSGGDEAMAGPRLVDRDAVALALGHLRRRSPRSILLLDRDPSSRSNVSPFCPGELMGDLLPEARVRVEAIRDSGAGAGATAIGHAYAAGFEPDAVVAWSFPVAVGAVRGLRAHGWAAGADVAVVSLTDDLLAEDFGITTVDRRLREVARLVAAALVSGSDLDADALRDALRPVLRVRVSTRTVVSG